MHPGMQQQQQQPSKKGIHQPTTTTTTTTLPILNDYLYLGKRPRNANQTTEKADQFKDEHPCLA
jgi:hypothetical protein